MCGTVYEAEIPRRCNFLVGQFVLLPTTGDHFSRRSRTSMRDLIKAGYRDGGQAEGTHVLRHHVVRGIDWWVPDASLAANRIELSWG